MEAQDVAAVPNTTRILVVDDHPIVREGVRRRLEAEPDLQVCGEAGSAFEATAFLAQQSCDLAVVDISLDGRSGLDLIKDVRSRDTKLALLVLSVHDDVTYVERALAAGAQGYVLKQEAPQTIVDAVRRVQKGEVYLSARIASKLLTRFVGRQAEKATGNPLHQLSDRELEVLECIGRGIPTRRIAERMHLAISTIETYKSRIKSKLNLGGASELAAYAAKWLVQRAS
jgi:DNA-binding NarL/FixJ family response regulator